MQLSSVWAESARVPDRERIGIPLTVFACQLHLLEIGGGGASLTLLQNAPMCGRDGQLCELR